MPSTTESNSCRSRYRIFPVAWQLFSEAGKLSGRNRACFIVNPGKQGVRLIPELEGKKSRPLTLHARHVGLFVPANLSESFRIDVQGDPTLLLIELEIFPCDDAFMEEPYRERPLSAEGESLVDSLNSARYDGRQLALIRAITELAADLFDPHDDEDLSRLTNYVRTHLGQPLATDDLSKALGITIHRLQTLTRERLGMTPAAYFRQERLHFACELLATTLIPIEQIAEKTGYSDRSSFSRAFAAAFKVRPGTYRENANLKP